MKLANNEYDQARLKASQIIQQPVSRPKDSFSEYLGAGLQGLAGSGGNPYIAAGLTALNFLNTTNAQDMAEKQYEAQRQAYEDQLGMNREARMEQQRNQLVANETNAANNASQYQGDVSSKFAPYARQIGL